MLRFGTVALVLALAAPSSHADGLREQAKAHYDLGRAEYQAGRYARALEEFQRSYRSAPIPELIFNIGRCQEELGDIAAAASSYRQYLAVHAGAEERAALEAHAAELERRGRASPRIEERSPAIDSVRASPRPVWRRGWFWGVLVAVVLAGAAAAVLAVALSTPRPAPLDVPAVASWH